ncbi:MAG TPA: hypothetical protein VGS27_06990 [Candidatus Sulfotelmatobacter sp.]|nr:hypothetical protein [Candidatus Sulfotelmatobacter sp.]
MKLANQQVRPDSRAKFPALRVKGISNFISVLVDQYGIACNQRQLRVTGKCFYDGFDFSGQPKVILIAQKYDLAATVGQGLLEGT